MEQTFLSVLRFVPFVGTSALALYCVAAGRIPVRGSVIDKSKQPNDYWGVLAIIVLFMVLPTLYLAIWG